MGFPECLRIYIFSSILALPLLLWGGPLDANVLATGELDVTVLVPPGAEHVDYLIPMSSAIDASLEPLHGKLTPIAGGVRFEPNGDFWEVGSDVTHLSLIRPAVVHRIRWVVGETGTDGPFLALGNPCTYPCVPWQILDETENPIWLGPGVLGGNAVRLHHDPDDSQSVRGDVGDAGSGDSTSTTSDFQVVIDDIDVDHFLLLGEIVKFYSVTDGPWPIADLETRWNGSVWQVRPVTSVQGTSPFVAIDREVNQIQLVRWTEGLRGGILLRVNDVLTHSLPAPPRLSPATEIHELLMETHSDDATSLELQFEEPTVRTSQTLVHLQPVTIQEQFTSGLRNWANMGVLAALGTQPQSLPGKGMEFRVDLDVLSSQESAYLEKGSPVGPALDADGWAFRFWIDPSALTLPVGSNLSVMVGCTGVGPCSQLRTRLDRTATGLKIVTTADDGRGGVAWLESDLGAEPHLVELRFRTAAFAGSDDGMVELRVDGTLVGRASDLENYAHPIGQVRLGALGVPVGTRGEVTFDAFESWRFD